MILRQARGRHRQLFGAVLLAVLAAGSAWLAQRAARPGAPEGAAAAVEREPDYHITAFAATVMDERGRPRYVLQALRLTHYPEQGAELERPYLIQYGQGTPVHTRARAGFLPDHRRWIRLEGEVVSARARDSSQAGGEIRAQQMVLELEP